MDTSKLEQQFSELMEANQQLAETVRIRDAEIVVLRRHVQLLSGEVIKCLQDGSYAEQAVGTVSPG